MKIIKSCIAIAVILALLNPLINPLKSYWHYKKALCLCTIGVLPTLYTDVKAKYAIPSLEKSIRYYPTWEACFLSGMAYGSLKNYVKSKEQYQLCLKYNPHYAKAHYNLGNVYFYLGEYDKAEEHYRQTLEIEPTLTSAENNIKVVRLAKERKNKNAAKTFSR